MTNPPLHTALVLWPQLIAPPVYFPPRSLVNINFDYKKRKRKIKSTNGKGKTTVFNESLFWNCRLLNPTNPGAMFCYHLAGPTRDSLGLDVYYYYYYYCLKRRKLKYRGCRTLVSRSLAKTAYALALAALFTSPHLFAIPWAHACS